MFKIEFNPRVGRYLKATCDIEPGTVIIDEPSIVDGPCIDKTSSSSFTDKTSEARSEANHSSVYVCPACYKKLPEVDLCAPPHCSRCDLILCSSECSNSQLHSRNECLIFSELPALLGSIFKHPSRRSSLCQFITTIRCLFLRSTNELKWNQLMQLQSNWKEFEESKIFDEVDEGFSLLSWNLFGVNHSEAENDILHMAHVCLGILRTNAFSQLTNDIGAERLFFFSSFMAHDCLMNTDRYFPPPEINTALAESSGRMVTKAAVKIGKGESITTMYMSFLASTPERQNDMKRVWKFHCTCTRCQDPTECNTHLSTIKCPACSLISLNSAYFTEDKTCKWTCSNESCDFATTDDQRIQGILDSTVLPIEELRPALLTNLEEAEHWLDTCDNGQVLHTNHSVFIQVKHFLCQYYGNEVQNRNGVSGLSNSRLMRKAKYCRQTLDVLDKFFNGIYLFKGTVLFHFWLALKEISTRQREQDETDDFAEMVEWACEESITKIAEMAHEILRHGDSNSKEELMASVLSYDDIKLFQTNQEKLLH